VLNMIMNTYKTECAQFIAWCRPKLGIRGVIKVKLIHTPIQVGAQRSFGYYDPNTQQIVISCVDRHPTDVLRTLAHELVHLAQSQIRPLTNADGVTGSDVENSANALAGILMRLWNTDPTRS
jgi:Zn-dependent peptidase ImmA (M78 family)